MPVKARDLIRALEFFGIVVRPSRGGSSHFTVEKEGRSFGLSLHNAAKSEVSDIYVKKICRTFGIDEKELRRKL